MTLPTAEIRDRVGAQDEAAGIQHADDRAEDPSSAGDRTSSRSPFSGLGAAERRTLLVLVALATVNAVGLVLVAEALARGVVTVIADDGSLRVVVTLGVIGAGLRGLATWGTAVVSVRDSQVAQRRSRHGLLTRVLRGGGADVPGGSGGLTALATSGLAPLDGWYARFLPAMAATMVVPLLIGLRILWADWVSALIIALTLPLIPLFMVLIGQETRDRVTAATDGLQRLANHLVELARGLPVLVGLGRAEAQTTALRDLATAFRLRTTATLRVAFLSSLALELIATLSVAVVAVFIGVRLVHGNFDLQTGLLILILAPECYAPLRQIGAAFHATEDGQEARRQVADLIRSPQGARVADGPPSSGGVEVRNLSVTYPDRKAATVRGQAIHLEVGTITVLRGPSGAGKSTVLAALLDQLPADTQVDGTISGIDRTRIAYLPQRPVLVTDLVDDEVALYAAEDPSSAVEVFLQGAGAGSLAGRHPAELSAGEIRRVALARVLARAAEADLIILDEPTAHLDAAHAQHVIAAIAGLRKDRTILVVSHDDRVLPLADQIVDLGSDDATVPARTDAPHPTGVDEPSARPSPGDRPSEIAGWRDLGLVMGPMWPRFLVASLAGAASLAAGIALAALSGWLIVRASEQPPILYLLGVIVGVRFFGIGRAVLRYGERLLSHDAILRAMTDLRLRIWQALARQGPAVGRRLRGDRAVDLLIREVDVARDLTLQVVIPVAAGWVVAALSILTTAVILPTAGWVLAAGLGMALVVGSAIAMLGGEAASVAEVNAGSKVTRLVGAIVAAAPDLRGNRVGHRLLARLEEAERASSQAVITRALVLGGGNALVLVSLIGASLGMLGIATTASVSPGMTAVLTLLPLALIEPVTGAIEAVQRWPALQVVLGKLKTEILEGERFAAEDRSSGTEVFGDGIDRLGLDAVTTGWPGQPMPVLRNVNLALQMGEWLTVTGPSGAGKSTLLSLLMLFLRPWHGEYRINCVSTSALAIPSVRQHIAWCPQDAHVFDSSIRANLLLARDRDHAPTDEELIAALNRVGLGTLLSEMANGLESRIGEAGRALSGGERQRLAVARMLLTRAPVMLVDEPTAHLDDETAVRLMGDLRAALHDKLVVTVTHRSSDIEPGDARLELEAGQR